MGLEKVLSISGKPGLYELSAQTRGGFVAKSILDGKKISVNVRHNVSLLSEIAIYTYTEEVPLGTIFQKIYEKENGGQAIDHKASKKELEDYFSEILPEYDEDRVYQSDIKKIIQWYNILVSHGYTDFSKEEAKGDSGEEVSEKENLSEGDDLQNKEEDLQENKDEK